jgi:hypothetical protein
MKLPKINNTLLFWAVYIAFLLVLLPQEAWTIGQGQDQTGLQWHILGVTASPLAWFLAGAFSASIAIVTHRLNVHWVEMPHRYKAEDMGRKRFTYRWLNVYAVALIVSMIISSIANLIHVVQFTNSSLKIFSSYPWAVGLYQFVFGLALPGVSFVFARVLSTMQESEQQEDPAFAKAKEELKEANSTIRSLEKERKETEQSIRLTEQRHSEALARAEQLLAESEQRYKAVGDVIRWLFGKDENLRDRIRGIRKAFPTLSQNGIAQIVGCSVSTVNDALQGYQVELPELIEVQS